MWEWVRKGQVFGSLQTACGNGLALRGNRIRRIRRDFVGCLALAIAEMLNTIPILHGESSSRHGLGFAVLSVALGKMVGSLISLFTADFPSPGMKRGKRWIIRLIFLTQLRL